MNVYPGHFTPGVLANSYLLHHCFNFHSLLSLPSLLMVSSPSASHLQVPAVLLSNECMGLHEPTEADLQIEELNEDTIMMLKSNLQPITSCMTKVDSIEAIYNYMLILLEGGKDPGPLLSSGLIELLLNISANDEAHSFCCDCSLPAIIFILSSFPQYQTYLLQMGVIKALLNLLGHNCCGPARSYAMECLANLSFAEEYHPALLQDDITSSILECLPFESWDLNCSQNATVILNNLLSSQDDEILQTAKSTLCQPGICSINWTSDHGCTSYDLQLLKLQLGR